MLNIIAFNTVRQDVDDESPVLDQNPAKRRRKKSHKGAEMHIFKSKMNFYGRILLYSTFAHFHNARNDAFLP